MPLEGLLRDVWGRRWRLALLAALFYALGATLVVTWPRRYVAQAVVAPAETTGIAASGLLTHPLNIASAPFIENRLAGHFAVYLDSIRSAEAARMLARETGLLDYLTTLRGEGVAGRIRRTLGLRLVADTDDAQVWLQRSLSVTPGIATVTLTLGVAHRDPAAALEVLQRLHAMAEAKVRADVSAMARRRVAALEARLATERDLFLRNALYELLAQQQRTLLIVTADEAMAARLVSGPVVGLRPSLPNRPLLLALLGVAVPLTVTGGAFCLALLGLARPRRPARRHQPELPFAALSRSGAD